ncbi:MAG TPA: sugar phosphate isomerase/epimerase [Candidatus Didemnitutus sp.]|nr:sugar phosphate isomerase/epimerase [Candidatus Didemnitutus sp.]
MKPVLALSTCWCSSRHQDGYEMLKEMAGLGFEWVELSHGIRITLVPGILRALEEGVIKVASCHNFCPLPTGVSHAAPNLYMPTSSDGRERDQWLRHSKRSIDFAHQVGARVLVLHLGAIEFLLFNPERAIEGYLDKHPGAGRSNDPVFRKKLEGVLAKLRAKRPPFFDRMKAGVDALLPYAAEKGIRLGFENRESLDELPLDEDFEGFLASFPIDGPAGYWHDTGHAQLKEDRGVLVHREHLAKNAPRAHGFHLHDVSESGQDHQPVGSGSVDFAMVSEFWRPEHTLVIELSPRVTTEGVVQSKERIEALVARRFGS